MRTGAKILREFEETVDLVGSWAKEPVFENEDLATVVGKLKASGAADPSSATLCPLVACIMGSELMFNPEAMKADSHQQISKYFQYCQATLKIAKKDLPKFMVEKLDKMQKDRIVAVSNSLKDRVECNKEILLDASSSNLGNTITASWIKIASNCSCNSHIVCFDVDIVHWHALT